MAVVVWGYAMLRILGMMMCAATVLFILSDQPLAADITVPFSVPGEGSASCAEYIVEPNMEEGRVQWVLGFIAGRLSGAKIGERIIDPKFGFNMPEFARGWLRTYCNRHPTLEMIDAADAMRKEILERKVSQ
jgi:hypothetical protein